MSSKDACLTIRKLLQTPSGQMRLEDVLRRTFANHLKKGKTRTGILTQIEKMTSDWEITEITLITEIAERILPEKIKRARINKTDKDLLKAMKIKW